MTGGSEFDRKRPVAGVLAEDEQQQIETEFGVGSEQVVRDHVISHALAAIASGGTDDVIFFGGTALSRTHLTTLRLSEDIDLIALGNRRAIGGRIETAITRHLQRALGTVTFTPSLRDTRHAEPSVMQVADARVQIQLVSSDGYPAWPTEVVEIQQRYGDAAPARLRVLTPAAFVAAKLSSWADRHASRDLYDLWGMGEKGMIGRAAVELFARMGSYTSAAQISFEQVPADAEWEAALGHQCVIRIGPRDAADEVKRRLTSALKL